MATNPHAESQAFLFVTVSSRTWAISRDVVQGIERVDRLTPPPDGSDAISMLPRATSSLPVYLMSQVLRTPDQRITEWSQIVILRTNGKEFGLLVDRVSSVQSISPENLFDCPCGFGPSERAVFQGVIRNDNQLILIIAPEALNAVATGRTQAYRPANYSYPRALNSKSDRWLVCQTSEKSESRHRPIGLGIESEIIAEVIEPESIMEMPANDSHVAGLMWYRNHPIAIIDLATRTGLSERSKPIQRVMIVATQNGFLAFDAGVRVSLQSKNIPHIDSRRQLPITSSQVRKVVDLDEMTVIFPTLEYAAC